MNGFEPSTGALHVGLRDEVHGKFADRGVVGDGAGSGESIAWAVGRGVLSSSRQRGQFGIYFTMYCN